MWKEECTLSVGGAQNETEEGEIYTDECSRSLNHVHIGRGGTEGGGMECKMKERYVNPGG